MLIFEFDHFDRLSQFHREWRQNIKISQFSRFLLRSEYLIQVKIWKWLKLLNSVPFIKKPRVNQVLHSNLIIVTDFHSFTVNEEELQNSQFSSLLLRYAI